MAEVGSFCSYFAVETLGCHHNSRIPTNLESSDYLF